MDAIEDLLAESIEDPATNVFAKILSDETSWPLKESDRDTLACFIAVQFLRGPDKRDQEGYIYDTLFNLAEKCEQGQITEEFLNEVMWKAYNGELSVNPQHHLHNLLDVENFLPYIYGRIWYLVRFKETKLITCDTPVIVNPRIQESIEINGIHLEQAGGDLASAPAVLLPLSREVGLVMMEASAAGYDKSKMDINDVATGMYDIEIDPTLELHKVFHDSVIENSRNQIFCHPEDRLLLPSPLPKSKIASRAVSSYTQKKLSYGPDEE